MMNFHPTDQKVNPLPSGSTQNTSEPQMLPLAECRLHVERAVEQISGLRVRRLVGAVFQDLLRLLECLSLIEGHLRHVDTAEESLAFFQLIRDEARSLIEFIRADVLDCEEISAELADTLDGITFALSHDLRRVFEGDKDPRSDKTPYVVLSRVHRAHDVLNNCLQQSTISLAIVFDRRLVGAKLFRNSDRRYRESLELCSDLTALRQQVDELRNRQSLTADATLMAGLESFRNQSLQFLMYSDWPQFESFCSRIQFSITSDINTLDTVLHQFQCYLETLLGQVKMRAVLADQCSASFVDDNSWNPLSAGPAAFSNKEECPEWGEFAFAV